MFKAKIKAKDYLDGKVSSAEVKKLAKAATIKLAKTPNERSPYFAKFESLEEGAHFYAFGQSNALLKEFKKEGKGADKAKVSYGECYVEIDEKGQKVLCFEPKGGKAKAATWKTALKSIKKDVKMLCKVVAPVEDATEEHTEASSTVDLSEMNALFTKAQAYWKAVDTQLKPAINSPKATEAVINKVMTNLNKIDGFLESYLAKHQALSAQGQTANSANASTISNYKNELTQLINQAQGKGGTTSNVDPRVAAKLKELEQKIATLLADSEVKELLKK